MGLEMNVEVVDVLHVNDDVRVEGEANVGGK